ncbi:MAG: hypothetical protein ACXVCH_18235 [Bdellovibrionota bacterium]
MRTRIPLFVTIVSFVSISSALALDVYPARGQSPEKQAADKAACQQFAKQETGFDPQEALSASPPPQQQKSAVRARKRARQQAGEMNAQKQQQAQLQQKMQAYNKAEGVCLKGRGYEVG